MRQTALKTWMCRTAGQTASPLLEHGYSKLALRFATVARSTLPKLYRKGSPSITRTIMRNSMALSVSRTTSGNPIYARSGGAAGLLVLTGQNATVTSLRAFFGRQIPIWEGHVRDALAGLITHANANQGNPTELARGTLTFLGAVATGFSPSAFGNRFVTEAQNGCAANCTGKPLQPSGDGAAYSRDPRSSGNWCGLGTPARPGGERGRLRRREGSSWPRVFRGDPALQIRERR